MTEPNFLNTLTSFAAQKGFIWGPSPEIYGGVSGFYTYGPLGKLLKNNVEDSIRKNFIARGFYEVECPTVLPEKVWQASGHLSGFTDPVIKDVAGNSFRVDNLIQEHCLANNISMDSMKIEGASKEELLKLVEELEIVSPINKKPLQKQIEEHNLMMKTTIGMDQVAFNRPETATATYLPFMRYAEFFRNKLPFAVFQIGKAYRNEISPRQFLLRMREFTQAEAQFFINPDEKNKFDKYLEIKNEKLPLWPAEKQTAGQDVENMSVEEAVNNKFLKNQAYAWTLHLAFKQFSSLGIPSERIRLRQHLDDEKAFYAEDAWDVEINLNAFGWTEVCGVHDRTDYDLKQHEKFSKTKLYATLDDGKKIKPHVLEIAFGTDRPVFSLLDLFYEKKKEGSGKSMFKIPYNLSGIQVAVFPLMKKDKLPEKAKEIFDDLQKEFIVKMDVSGSIGKRYLRAAEEAIPFCVTVDYDSLQNDDVTIRDRDTEEQKRIKISDLKQILHSLISENKKINEV